MSSTNQLPLPGGGGHLREGAQIRTGIRTSKVSPVLPSNLPGNSGTPQPELFNIAVVLGGQSERRDVWGAPHARCSGNSEAEFQRWVELWVKTEEGGDEEGLSDEPQ